MATERTLSIIKPSAVRDNHIGAILAKFEAAGLRIIAAKMTQLTQAQAEAFYAVHAERPFFAELVEFMTSGPVMVQALEGDNAIKTPCMAQTRRIPQKRKSASFSPPVRFIRQAR